MWFKKETRNNVDYSALNSVINELSIKYKTGLILKPKVIDKSSKFKIMAQVYLPIPAYVITVEEDFTNEDGNEGNQ